MAVLPVLFHLLWSHELVVERAQAKAEELGVSLRTVQSRRSRYARQGLWGGWSISGRCG
ncbi:hypothetical protein OG609_06790 [Streptomyces sp. NBC_01224]|uniref:hypothetical protein n=1 Tax=Streptomyces sp. NBC_01224 TaxID=2903783 RepID=UPI002E0F8837|nr:hypothetical protein OG609_06790 [Streptomyces sp. NBC_01224]